MSHPPQPRVQVVTLGCGRNEVDSEELAGRLDGAGFRLVAGDGAPDLVLVNTCGFVAAAKKDSVDTLLAAADTGAKVVAVGCLAQRYGEELARELPEADAVLGFDAYADLPEHLRAVLAGQRLPSHTPSDRRRLLPLAPADRSQRPGPVEVGIPGHAGGPTVLRHRLEGGPVAPLKLASGCDRRCSFCAIPSFRGAFASRRPAEVLAEARWLAERGVRELVLVSENSTSYGKDLGDLRLLEALLPELGRLVPWVRVSYLQPAELRPSLVAALTSTSGVLPYFDLSFQHAAPGLLRRMRRFGGTERFLDLLDQIRAAAPAAGVRSNVIVGFPGETEDDLAELTAFLTAARLDAIGVFGFSPEDGTEAAGLPGGLDQAEVDHRIAQVSALAEELTAQRAEDRLGERVEVLVESVNGGVAEGRAAHQAPDVDGSTTLRGSGASVGQIVPAVVVATQGVDLVAERVGP